MASSATPPAEGIAARDERRLRTKHNHRPVSGATAGGLVRRTRSGQPRPSSQPETPMLQPPDHTSQLSRSQRKAMMGTGCTVLDSILMDARADVSVYRHAGRIRSSMEGLLRQAHMAACIACDRPLSIERSVGGRLIAFSTPRPRATSTSPICRPCWQTEPIAELSRHAEIALGRIIVGGRWLDPAPPDSG